MNHKSAVEEAYSLVNGDRQSAYGHPLDDFSRTAKIWSAIFGHEVTAEQVALCMIGVKMSREVNRPGWDNIVDMAGYAETLTMVRQERLKRTTQSERKNHGSLNNHRRGKRRGRTARKPVRGSE